MIDKRICHWALVRQLSFGIVDRGILGVAGRVRTFSLAYAFHRYTTTAFPQRTWLRLKNYFLLDAPDFPYLSTFHNTVDRLSKAVRSYTYFISFHIHSNSNELRGKWKVGIKYVKYELRKFFILQKQNRQNRSQNRFDAAKSINRLIDSYFLSLIIIINYNYYKNKLCKSNILIYFNFNFKQ
jgi:hypothetical protein